MLLPSPAVMTKLPPVADAAVASPANIKASPPFPEFPLPTRTRKSPPLPLLAAPVPIVNAPELPLAVVPVCMVILPDVPYAPEFGVLSLIGPEDETAL